MDEPREGKNMSIRFTIPLEPVGQMRPRLSTHGGFAKAYKAGKQKLAEDQLLALAVQHRPETPLEGPLCLTVDAYMAIPKSFSKAKRSMALSGDLRPAKKPDASNVAKHLEDCFNGIFWRDDAQIVGLLVRKFYSDRPRWEIEIKPTGGTQ